MLYVDQGADPGAQSWHFEPSFYGKQPRCPDRAPTGTPANDNSDTTRPTRYRSVELDMTTRGDQDGGLLGEKGPGSAVELLLLAGRIEGILGYHRCGGSDLCRGRALDAQPNHKMSNVAL